MDGRRGKTDTFHQHATFSRQLDMEFLSSWGVDALDRDLYVSVSLCSLRVWLFIWDSFGCRV